MKQAILLILLSLFASFMTYAQPTHGVSFQLGLINNIYKSAVPNVKNTTTHFLPSYSFEYGKFSENLFWGGCGLGISVRNIPFYKYNNSNTIGVQAPEFWFKVKTGFHIHNEFMTHLPFISLGIGKYGQTETYYKNQNGISYNNIGNYKNFNLQTVLPFMELGTTLINSTFTESKRSIFLTFSCRYYPLPLFKTKTDIEYEIGEVVSIQYNLIEFNIIAGIQKNLRRN
ncbi:MAG: hypothetical protein IPF62_14800 [Bacteroidetes bacterium]|nr:hypothetical protein [Bacteroidota bacterium]